MVIGGSAAVYLALYWFPKDEFWKYQTRQERQTVAELRKENEQLRSEIAGADPAKSALNSYFAALQKRQYADAYAVVSKARLEEREREFGPKHFEQYQSTFTNTLGYDNIAIALVSTSSVGRKYAVSYDVTDSVPRNELYEDLKQLLSSLTASKLLNLDAINDAIIANVGRYHMLEDKTADAIKSYVKNRKIGEIFDPLFIVLLERSLHERWKIDLGGNPQYPEKADIKRRYAHEITMIQEGSAWKIRSGLGNPVIANY